MCVPCNNSLNNFKVSNALILLYSETALHCSGKVIEQS